MPHTEPINSKDRAQVIRELISDAASETPRSIEDGVEQQGAVNYLRRKLDELETQVITGD